MRINFWQSFKRFHEIKESHKNPDTNYYHT